MELTSLRTQRSTVFFTKRSNRLNQRTSNEENSINGEPHRLTLTSYSGYRRRRSHHRADQCADTRYLRSGIAGTSRFDTRYLRSETAGTNPAPHSGQMDRERPVRRASDRRSGASDLLGRCATSRECNRTRGREDPREGRGSRGSRLGVRDYDTSSVPYGAARHLRARNALRKSRADISTILTLRRPRR